jgi:hypothetical protein
VRNGFLLPFRVVRDLFRGKLLARLRHALARGDIVAPAELAPELARRLARLHGRRWNVHLRERYPHTGGILRYLGRYLRGGPIGNHRLLSLDDSRVVFRYTDHRDGRAKSLALPLEHFVQRVIWHIPEPHGHLVRYWGLYARGCKPARERCREQLLAAPPPSASVQTPQGGEPARPPARERCALCGRPLVFLGLLSGCRGPPALASR